MSVRIHTDIDNLAAPAADGAVLIWPDVRTILRAASARGERRLDVESAAITAGAARVGGPRIMTGHQPEFFHPGVWVKLLVATALGRRLGGDTTFLLVDSDTSDGAPLAWSERVNAEWRRSTAATYPAERAEPFEALRGIGESERVFNEAEQALRACGVWNDVPGTWQSFKEAFLKPGAAEESYVSRWARGMEAMAEALGLSNPRIVRVSELFSGASSPAGSGQGVSSFEFVACLILNAPRFHHDYNQALRTFRERRGIRGDRHPVPDLGRDGDRYELPFWLWRPGEVRRRMSIVARPGESVGVWTEAVEIGRFTRKDMVKHPTATLRTALGPWRLRPRALALTLYARLFLSDHFLHGIGGAKYDQITDDVIRRFFNVEPPVYSCATATLHLPVPDVGTASHGSAATDGIRNARFNPQRFLGDHAPAGVRALLQERAEAISTSARLREQTPAEHALRKAAYERIRQVNQAIHAARPELLDDAMRRVQYARQAADWARIAENREWFVGLYPAARLRTLAEDVDRRIASQAPTPI